MRSSTKLDRKKTQIKKKALHRQSPFAYLISHPQPKNHHAQPTKGDRQLLPPVQGLFYLLNLSNNPLSNYWHLN